MPRLLLVILAAALPANPLCAGTLAQFRTVYGDIEVELLDQDKPVTTRNFIRLVEANVYSNMFLHRCLPGFVVQGGGFYATNAASTNLFGPPPSVPHFGAITNEFLTNRVYSNVYGTLAMAKVAGNPHSATCQWFFNLADNAANLDNQNGGFTVFGQVLRGFSVLDYFNTLARSNGIVNLVSFYGAGASTFSDLPVLYTGHVAPRYVDLVYCDVTLLRVAVSNAGPAGMTVAWNSPTGLVNLVEYTDGFNPLSWHELHRTHGTGGRLEITDTNALPHRFYRVRVEHPPAAGAGAP